MILERLWVILRLLKDLLHNGVSHDTLWQMLIRTRARQTQTTMAHRNLGITHRSLESLFLCLFALLRIQCLLTLQLLLCDLPCVLVFYVVLPRLLYCLQGFRILSHGEQYVGLADVSFNCVMVTLINLNTAYCKQPCSPNLGSTLMASFTSFSASGSATNFIYAAARLLYPRASAGSRFMLSL